jgi:uncharacterized membrane protein
MLSPSSNPSLVNNGGTVGEATAITAFIVFIVIWAFFGLVAFIYSFFCFSRSGTFLEKTLGLVIAFFTGPFYFLYLKYNDGYCK